MRLSTMAIGAPYLAFANLLSELAPTNGQVNHVRDVTGFCAHNVVEFENNGIISAAVDANPVLKILLKSILVFAHVAAIVDPTPRIVLACMSPVMLATIL
jgi:hypothetical protein